MTSSHPVWLEVVRRSPVLVLLGGLALLAVPTCIPDAHLVTTTTTSTGQGAQAGSGGDTTTTSVTGGVGGVGGSGGSQAGSGGTPAAVCGNGDLEPGEECDDGNLQSGDACSPTCKRTVFDIGTGATRDGPDVATAGNESAKGFRVVWRDDDGAGTVAIEETWFSAVGAPGGAAVAVSSTPSPDKPRCASNSSGLSLVAWRSGADANAIRFRSILATGSPSGAADQLIASSQSQSLSAIASRTGGEFCLGWLGDSPPPQAQARCFNAQGQATFTVTQPLGQSDGASSVGMWSNGASFIAAWSQADGVLRAEVLDTTGTPQGSAFQIPSNGNSNRAPVGVGLGSNGGHVAVFEQVFGSGPTYTRVTKREFDTASTSSHIDSFVSTSLNHDEQGPAVAAANGKFVVAWADMAVNFGDILAQAFDGADGSAIGVPVDLNLTAPAGVQSKPRVAVNADGDAMFVWESTNAGTTKVSALIYPRLVAP
jgi:cysteine-rich repeat protein